MNATALLPCFGGYLGGFVELESGWTVYAGGVITGGLFTEDWIGGGVGLVVEFTHKSVKLSLLSWGLPGGLVIPCPATGCFGIGPWLFWGLGWLVWGGFWGLLGFWTVFTFIPNILN